MKKIMIMLMVLLMVGSVGAISQSQFESYTDNQIKSYLVNHVSLVHRQVNQQSESLVFYFSVPDLVPGSEDTDEDYVLINDTVSASLPLDLVIGCLDDYTELVCMNNLYYRTTPLVSVDSNDLIYPVYYQVLLQLESKFDRIKQYKAPYDIGDFGTDANDLEVTI